LALKVGLTLSGLSMSLRRLFAFVEVKTRNRDLTTVLFTHYPQQLRGKVHDYVNPLAIQINVSVVCKHED
jgi:hypothetical protein